MNKDCPIYNPDLEFDEGRHKYWLKSDPSAKFVSTTTFIDQFFQPFNAPKIAADLVNNHPKYQGMTVKELLREWNKSSVHGTKVHNELENYITGDIEPDKLSESKSLQGVLWLDGAINQNKYDIYPEVRICSGSLGISGTIDLLVHNPNDDTYVIGDWKTNKKISKSGYRGRTGIKLATYNVEDCKYNKYALQMSLYRYILENDYNAKVKRQVLIHLKDNGRKIYYPPYMKKVITKMLEQDGKLTT